MPTHSLPMLASRAAVSRRAFVALAAALGARFVAGCAEQTPAADVAPSPTPDAGSDAGAALSSLGGAPDTPTGRVIAAFVDTVVPGRWRDPTGAPGGLDTGAAALFFDPALPALPFVELLAGLLNAETKAHFAGATFDALSPGERDGVVTSALASTDLLGFAVQLVMLAFFSSREAGAYLGYPGPNPGYRGDPDYSFERPMATEITLDGNLA